MSPTASSQLPLEIGLRDSATFASFYAGENATAVGVLQAGSEPFIFLAGKHGTGKSHLLQALCHEIHQQARSSAYLPLGQHAELAPAMCEGLEALPLICLDDIDAIAGQDEWEAALFHLYNRVRDAGGRLLATARQVPAEIGFVLPDLASRLAWGPVFQLKALSDIHKLAALQHRADVRGLALSDEVGEYLLRRSPRDMGSLFELLEKLDRESLVAQRRLTIPFVRDLLALP